ncbi:Protein SOSEKI 1 [Pleosporales sp. CAS-2024a]
MNTRAPKPATSKTTSLGTARHGYTQASAAAADTLAIEGSSATWHGPLISRDGPSSPAKSYPTDYASRPDHTDEPPHHKLITSSNPSPAPARHLDYPEELAHMIITMRAGQYYEQLAKAYLEASEIPPITKQSLSELDIHHIITNSRLRHDVNYDRDLCFRPNLDGAKGQQKRQATEQYWKALEAELELYATLFHPSPAPRVLQEDNDRWAALIQNAQRRIPAMFSTIQEILKSLVPDRDHPRIDEHLDLPMLIQEIERGVCDLVRLAEWMAQLLKEHCAPMRDAQVDGMVALIRSGVVGLSSAKIVDGLRDLFAILETMKLDVANHQIRNLKTLLIEDTIHFEKRHHLDRLVSHRSRVNIANAQAWYISSSWEFADRHSPQPRSLAQTRLEVFAHAVVAQLFNRNGRYEFPDTFYLDQDRLRVLKAEIEDLIHMEVCMDAFASFLKQFGCDGCMSPHIRMQLHTALLAIMGGSMGYGTQQWIINSEALSLEILRQASIIAKQAPTLSHDALSLANEHLLHMFYNSFNTHNPRLEDVLFSRVINCVERHTKSTATDLFNSLVPAAATIPSAPSTQLSHLVSSFVPTLTPETARWQDIANRITHIILLHWRIWEHIAYVQEDGPERSTTTQNGSDSAPSSQQPFHRPQNSLQAPEHDQHLITAMKTVDSVEAGQETIVPHHTPSQ